MIELLNTIFYSFWTFAGTLILLSVGLSIVGKIILGLVAIVLNRDVNIK